MAWSAYVEIIPIRRWPRLEEVLDGGGGRGHVVDPDAAGAGDVVADGDDRHAEAAQVGDLGLAELHGDDEDRVDAAAQGELPEEALAGRDVAEVVQQQVEVVLAQDGLGAGDDLAEEPARGVRDDHPDGVGAAAGETGGDRRHDVRKRRRGLQHAVARLVGDVGQPSEGA